MENVGDLKRQVLVGIEQLGAVPAQAAYEDFCRMRSAHIAKQLRDIPLKPAIDTLKDGCKKLISAAPLLNEGTGLLVDAAAGSANPGLIDGAAAAAGAEVEYTAMTPAIEQALWLAKEAAVHLAIATVACSQLAQLEERLAKGANQIAVAQQMAALHASNFMQTA